MRVVAAVLLLVGLVHARPQLIHQIGNAAQAQIVKFTNFINEHGEYTYDVETSDGQARYETRKVVNPGTDHETSVVEGYYAYIDPEGERKVVGYRADENGFEAEGDHLPNSANARRKPPQLGVPPSAVASLAGGGLGR